MIKAIIPTTKQKSNKWTRQIDRRRQHKIIIDSGATSHFMIEDLHLPTEGASNKEVYLPSNAKLRTSRQTKLPFDNLTNAAREADVLPRLKRSLLSVNKMSEEGYMTIFHPGEDGVMIHKEGTITIPPDKIKDFQPEFEELLSIEKDVQLTSLWTTPLTLDDVEALETDEFYPTFIKILESK